MKMKKIYMVLTFAGIINCQSPVYQDVKLWRELIVKIESRINMTELIQENMVALHELNLALANCEEAGDCETSRELELLFKKVATTQIKIKKIQEDQKAVDMSKQIVEIYEKYQE